MKAATESTILAQCLQWLSLQPGVMAWRSNNAGTRRRDKNGREFWSFTGMKGVSDILGVVAPNGRLLAVETKRPGGRLSPQQAFFLDSVRKLGGIAIVVHSLDELIEAMNQ